MSRTGPLSLASAAEEISPSEMCVAPELPTLAALDALLLAAINLLEFQTPSLGWDIQHRPHEPLSPDESIAEAIHILAKALRKNLVAYYAVIRAECEEHHAPEEEIGF